MNVPRARCLYPFTTTGRLQVIQMPCAHPQHRKANFTRSVKEDSRTVPSPTLLYTGLKEIWICIGCLCRPGKANPDTAVWNHTQLCHSKGSHYKTFIAPICEAKWQMAPVKSLQSGPKSSTTPFLCELILGVLRDKLNFAFFQLQK